MLGTIIAIVCLAALAFFSAPLWLWVAVGVFGLLTGVFTWWFALPWLAVCALLGMASLRMKFVSRPAFKLFKNILPPFPRRWESILAFKKPVLFNSLSCLKMDSRLRGNDGGFICTGF